MWPDDSRGIGSGSMETGNATPVHSRGVLSCLVPIRIISPFGSLSLVSGQETKMSPAARLLSHRASYGITWMQVLAWHTLNSKFLPLSVYVCTLVPRKISDAPNLQEFMVALV